MMKKFIIPLTLICLYFKVSAQKPAQFNTFNYAKTFEKKIDSIFYKSSTTWIIPTPFIYNKQFYSIDEGQTYLKAGPFGQNLKPNLLNTPDIRSNINIYTSIRIIGVSQMVIVAPYFLIKDINWIINNDFNRVNSVNTVDKRPPNLWYALGFFISGSLTYHLLSKPFIKKALSKHHHNKHAEKV
ncbi:MAG: hypothetical protein HYX39_04280 [Bacteroidetes bacterium]|nr:hypothetical protein [Bacteroidota bacterium]